MSKKIEITEIQLKRILDKIISESYDESDIDEMSREASKNWPTHQLDPGEEDTMPESFDIDYFETPKLGRIPVIGKNPSTGEYVPGKVFTKDLRKSASGHMAILFTNHEKKGAYYVDKTRWAVLSNDKTKIDKIYPDEPRNTVYSSSWKGPAEKEVVNQNTRGVETQTVRRDPEDLGKRILFDVINRVFSEPELFKHEHKCAIPEIVANAKTTERKTNVNRVMSFSGPNLSFTISTMRNFSDPQTAIDKSLGFRMALDFGDEPEVQDMPDYMRRQFANAYPGSKWESSQAADSKKVYKGKTPIYHLKKKFVQEGESYFNRHTFLVVRSRITADNILILEMTFYVDENRRSIDSETAKNIGHVIQPIDVMLGKRLPGLEGINSDEFTVAKYPEFYRSLFNDVLELVKERIMNINPDDTMPDIDPGQDVEFD